MTLDMDDKSTKLNERSVAPYSHSLSLCVAYKIAAGHFSGYCELKHPFIIRAYYTTHLRVYLLISYGSHNHLILHDRERERLCDLMTQISPFLC